MLRNFSWIVPARLAGMAWPGSGNLLSGVADELRAEGIGLVVTLTQRRLEAERLEAAGLAWLHLPVNDYAAPTLPQLDAFVRAVDQTAEAGAGTVAHCAAGIGRTGTCLAAYLVHTGVTASQAIAQIREARPGSIEAQAQERAVAEFEAFRSRPPR